jgi:hypothetical protein
MPFTPTEAGDRGQGLEMWEGKVVLCCCLVQVELQPCDDWLGLELCSALTCADKLQR